METLPREILQLIFNYFKPDPETLNRLALVCRHWSIVSTPILWSNPSFQSRRGLSLFLEKAYNRNPSTIQSITLSRIRSSIPHHDLSRLFDLIPSTTVRFLDLRNCKELCDKSMESIKKVKLNLVSIMISSTSKLTDEGIKSLATATGTIYSICKH